MERRLILVTDKGETRETSAAGYFAEGLMDKLFHDLKAERSTRYLVLFHGGSMRSEYYNNGAN
jgi:hypothetical protein